MADASGSSVLATLNAAQRRAVTSDAATVAILAGPGSGKTHTLTSRVAWLVDAVGYQPEDVIVATFTVKAAREMKERIGKALGGGRERKIILGTFHSIARRYLAAYGNRIGLSRKFGIADDADSRAIISRICKRAQLSVDPPMARAWISKKKAKGTETGTPSKPPQARQQSEPAKDLEACYREYQDQLGRSNLLDYDDLLVKCVELLHQFPSCVANVQAVLIDEYQDTNGVQYELMKLFAQRHRRVTIVGDPDQSIYGWRSAEIRNLYRMLRDFPGTDEVSLEENYRSSQSILDTALKVIQQDQKRYQKVLVPIHNRGTRPVLRRLRNSAKEADWVVSEIRRIVMLSGNMLAHDDIAILLRSASLSRHIEGALGRSGIVYRMIGGFKFYERAEIKIILDYLRVIHQPENNDALGRIINVPKRGIGEGTIKSLVEEAETSSSSLWTRLVKHCRGDRLLKTNIKKQAEQKLSGELLRLVNDLRRRIDESAPPSPFTLVSLVEELLRQLKFEAFLHDSYPEDHESRWANVQEFLGLASDFAKGMEQVGDESLPDIEGLDQEVETDVLAKFLANVSLASDVQKDGEEGKKPLVTISTIHAAKGLEWPVVFVPAAYNGSIPHTRSEDGDEERRLLYVAMTRAQALLYLSCPLLSTGGNGEKLELSPFLSPISSGYFAKRGPSFQKPTWEGIGRILGRAVPTDDAIFKSMPLLASQEDDLFPIDPEQKQENAISEVGTAGAYPTEGPRAKRARMHGPAGGGVVDEDRAWYNGYATTMDQASGFTVASLPGFVSAGTHQSALAAAGAASAKKLLHTAEKAAKRPTTKRASDQRSLLGFVRTKSNPDPQTPSALVSGADHRPSVSNDGCYGLQRPQALANARDPSAAARPAIDPALAGHKLGSARVTTRPVPAKRDGDGPRKPYAQFSSSPTRPPPPLPRPSRDVAPPEANGGAEPAGDDEEVPAAARAASTLHSTAIMMPRGTGAIKRPAVLARGGIERVRRPFKPLTINRQ